MSSNWNSNSILVGMKNDAIFLKGSLAAFFLYVWVVWGIEPKTSSTLPLEPGP
jgi:hypothetical protein